MWGLEEPQPYFWQLKLLGSIKRGTALLNDCTKQNAINIGENFGIAKLKHFVLYSYGCVTEYRESSLKNETIVTRKPSWFP